jgi:patatin-like phospholipase/acyl hydrolase
MHIEEELGENGAVLKYFDWIAGTSTGAILALLLATQTPLIDCLRLYLRFKDDVFVG